MKFSAIIMINAAAIYPEDEPYVFEANRPCILCILFEGIPLFSGVFVGAQ